MEKRIINLFNECCQEQAKLNIPFSTKISGIKINSRAKSRFGCCKASKKGGILLSYTIEISSEMLSCSDQDIKTVIHHELLHTVKGCMNHGEKWKSYAEKLNRIYGYNIKRATTYETFSIEKPVKSNEYKYVVKCVDCGLEYKRKKMCKLIEHTENYKCGKCGGKLKLL